MARITKIEATSESREKKLRVAAYARVSTASEEQLASLKAQKRHYESYIKSRRDWEFVGLYYDEGITGTKMDRRDDLQRLLMDCERGEIDYIIVKSISRFSRNTVECIETVRRLSEMGVFLFFEKENIDTGKMEGELMLSILSSLAESESRSIADNEAWSIKRRFMNGSFIIGYPPYGYKNVDGKMEIVEEEAEIVRWIFQEVLSGTSPSRVAKKLNDRKIPSKRNGHWTGHTINGMIKNEKYTGDVLFQKSYTDDQFNRHNNYGERPQYLLPDHHEAIISHETADAARAILARNGKEKGNGQDTEKYTRRYAFSGRIICGECGGSWKRISRSDGYAYTCGTHIKNKDRCSMLSIKESSVKSAFCTMMNKLIFARDRILLPYDKGLRTYGSEAEMKRFQEVSDLLDRNKERKQQILQFLTKGILDPAVFTKENNLLLDEERALLIEQNSLIRKISGNSDPQEALQKLLHYTGTAEMLTEFDDELFKEHVDHIEVYSRTEVGFVMKCGPTFRERIE